MLAGVVPVFWIDMLAGMRFRTVQLEPWHSSRSQSDFHADGLVDVTVTQYLCVNLGYVFEVKHVSLRHSSCSPIGVHQSHKNSGYQGKPRVPIDNRDEAKHAGYVYLLSNLFPSFALHYQMFR